MAKKYAPNNVYILEIHGCQYYVGCHTRKEEMTEAQILWNSANPLKRACCKGLITTEEYRECCRIIRIEEYDTPEEALDREAELIEKFKNHYSDQCLNRSKGNKYGSIGSIGMTLSEETRKKMSESRKGQLHSEWHKKRISESLRVNGVLQFDLYGNFIKEYPSTMEASRQTGINQGNICSCCKGHLKSAGKSVWQYA